MSATLFINGRFWPLGRNRHEARVLLARNGIIEAIGARSEKSIRGILSNGAEVIDLGGRIAIPGPVDAHCHLVSYGMGQTREADLRGVQSLAELVDRLHAHARKLSITPGSGKWLLGRGFDQDLLKEQRWPTRSDLDSAAPDVPIRITRVCGHALVANTEALTRAGLNPSTRQPGFPEGVITESAMTPVHVATPTPSDAEWLQAARWACQAAARSGFVGVHSLMAHSAEVRALVDLRKEGPLPVRVRMQFPFSMLDHARGAGLRTGFGDDYLRIGAIKLFSDGSLGARTAALREPYLDDPSTCGELIYAADELKQRVRAVFDAGFQVCIHAIGDRAMDITLDAIEGYQGGAGWIAPPRIEHASLVDAKIIERMRSLNVGAAVQPQFAHSDYWSPVRLGDQRAAGCYAFRTLHTADIVLAGSTDCPVEALDAMAAIGQMVHRPSWSPDEELPLETVLRIFSEGSYAIDRQPNGPASPQGRLAPGEYADFTVLDQDPRALPPSEIQKIPVAMTVVGGKVVHRAG